MDKCADANFPCHHEVASGCSSDYVPVLTAYDELRWKCCLTNDAGVAEVLNAAVNSNRDHVLRCTQQRHCHSQNVARSPQNSEIYSRTFDVLTQNPTSTPHIQDSLPRANTIITIVGSAVFVLLTLIHFRSAAKKIRNGTAKASHKPQSILSERNT